MREDKLLLAIFISFCSAICVAQNIDYNEFEGSKVKINSPSQLSEPYWLDYSSLQDKLIDTAIVKPVTYNIAEKVISNKYRDLLSLGIEKNYIRLYQKLTFLFKGNQVSIIGYKNVSNGKASSIQEITISKNQSNQWQEINSQEIKNFGYIVKNINSVVFWKFYNNENNSKYPEINKLKPQVKDANGVLNIQKLAKVFKENQAQLQQYIDE